MNEKVYVVTAGIYSDYGIVGIFSTREKAEEYINHSTDRDLNEIEEWTLDELKPDKSRKLYAVASGFHNIDCRIQPSWTGDVKDMVLYDKDGGIRLCVEAVTREQAIKVVAERIRSIKAEEHIRYPLLRRMCTYTHTSGYDKDMYPTYLYHTGEIVIPDGYKLTHYDIPEALEHTVKSISLEELKEREQAEVEPEDGEEEKPQLTINSTPDWDNPNYMEVTLTGEERIVYQGKFYSLWAPSTVLPSNDEYGIYIRLDKVAYKALLMFCKEAPKNIGWSFVRIGTAGATDGVNPRSVELDLKDIELF